MNHISTNEVRSWIFAFLAGFFVLMLLSKIVKCIVGCLREKGGASERHDLIKDYGIGMSHIYGSIEQFLFYLTAISSKEVFAGAVAGWLVLKGIHQYAAWEPKSIRLTPHQETRAAKKGLDRDEIRNAIARNKFMIFSIGTAMSIAAGGIAGSLFHFVYEALHKCV